MVKYLEERSQDFLQQRPSQQHFCWWLGMKIMGMNARTTPKLLWPWWKRMLVLSIEIISFLLLSPCLCSLIWNLAELHFSSSKLIRMSIDCVQ
jgi:hypothetical protein